MKFTVLLRTFLKLKTWLLVEMVIIGLCVLVYVSVQYNVRSTANNPQIEISQNIATELAASNETLTPTDLSASAIDPNKTLGTFYMVFDANQALLASTANFNGQSLVPPAGVFDNAKAKGDNRITWQPSKDLRLAIVVAYFKGEKNEGFALVGRSLKETEKVTNNVLLYAAVAALSLSAGNTLILGGAKLLEKRLAAPAAVKESKSVAKKQPLKSKTRTKKVKK